MRITGIIAAVIVLSGATMLSDDVRLNFFRIQPEGREFVVSWQADVEQGVERYELFRKTTMSNDQFVEVFASPPHGISKEYQFRDSQVYKSASEQLDYRLDVVYSTGARQLLSSKSINYTSTAVRRTWGSLKALFQ